MACTTRVESDIQTPITGTELQIVANSAWGAVLSTDAAKQHQSAPNSHMEFATYLEHKPMGVLSSHNIQPKNINLFGCHKQHVFLQHDEPFIASTAEVDNQIAISYVLLQQAAYALQMIGGCEVPAQKNRQVCRELLVNATVAGMWCTTRAWTAQSVQ